MRWRTTSVAAACMLCWAACADRTFDLTRDAPAAGSDAGGTAAGGLTGGSGGTAGPGGSRNDGDPSDGDQMSSTASGGSEPVNGFGHSFTSNTGGGSSKDFPNSGSDGSGASNNLPSGGEGGQNQGFFCHPDADPCPGAGMLRCFADSGQCLPACDDSNDCATGTKCDPDAQVCVDCYHDQHCPDDRFSHCLAGQCYECRVGEDCRQTNRGQYCIAGKCRRCLSSEDCEPGQMCGIEGCY